MAEKSAGSMTASFVEEMERSLGVKACVFLAFVGKNNELKYTS